MLLLEGLDVATITMMSIEDLFAWIDDHPHTLLLNKQVVTLPLNAVSSRRRIDELSISRPARPTSWYTAGGVRCARERSFRAAWEAR